MTAPGKKFMNKSEDVVEEMVEGILACSRNLCRVGSAPQHVLARKDFSSINSTQVVLISGGGSGHEPAHAGFIGDGMLTGAVLGGVFASPSSSAVLSAIMALSGAPGCLLIVKNYTGDRLNFGIAMEKARAKGIQCEMCIVGDDCALPKNKGITGRRGIAGTLFVHKIAGAAAAARKSLREVTAEARAAAESVATMGVALTTCTLPGLAPNPRLDGDVIEIGLGIHGEPGTVQSKWRPCDELVDEALKSILDPIKGGDNKPYLEPVPGAHVAVLINSLGATPPMELAILGRRIVAR
jgi:dihydroxyacetone kinase